MIPTTCRSEVTVLPSSPDGLAEARRIRAAWEAVPRYTYDGSQAGDRVYFEAALAAGLERSRLRDQAVRLVGGTTADDRAVVGRLVEEGWRQVLEAEGEEQLAAGNRAAVSSLAAPTAEQFLRHAEKFGWEGVRETAAAMSVDLTVKRRRPAKRPKRQRRSTQQLAGQVVSLADRGLITAAIADQLNVSDRRVKAILAAKADSPKPHKKRLDQPDCGPLVRPNDLPTQLTLEEAVSA